MNYNIPFLACIFMIIAICNGMDQEASYECLDGSTISYALGKQKGELAAQAVFDRHGDCNELLKSIREQLEITIPLARHPEAQTQFHSFVYGIVWELKRRKLTFNEKAYTEQIASQVGNNEDTQKQQIRKELVELLTTGLKKAEMLM